MLDILTGTLAPYIAGAIGLVMLFFGINSKVKTATIEKQKEVIKNHEVDNVVLESAINTQKETIEIVEKSNEILSERVDVNDAVKRLRERRSERDNCGEG